MLFPYCKRPSFTALENNTAYREKNKENTTELKEETADVLVLRSVLKQPPARRHVVHADRWSAVATTRPDKALVQSSNL